MPSRDSGYVLAFDFGLRHIGTAVGQHFTGTATPLETIKARGGRPDWPAISALLEAWPAQALVVGLPLNMDESESELCDAARSFARALAERFAVPVHLVDERLTTRAALARTGGDHRAAHNIAAALIAESFLESNRIGEG